MGTDTWTNFEYDDFKCRHCGENKMSPVFIDKLQALRDRVGFPLIVISGYRCPTHNQNVSTTGPHGPHTTGHAADLAVERGRAYAVMTEACKMGGFTGFGFDQKGGGRFIHLDDLEEPSHAPRPTVWTY